MDRKKLEIKTETILSKVSGEIETSLWDTLVNIEKEKPELVYKIVNIFAWQIDFFSEVFPKDTFRLLIEKNYVKEEFVGYKNILATEFVSRGRKYRAYIYDQNTNALPSYYDEKGQSLQKQLLKAPLKYAPITSKFGKRKHPILGYTRNHNGIDYGVPTGTPIYSVGDGRIIMAGFHGGYGKFIEIRHANGWISEYAHLSKIHTRKGAYVSQKELIGRVGTTGLSTGPHLHYALKKNQIYVNPLKQKFSSGKSLKNKKLLLFLKSIQILKEKLDTMEIEQKI